METLEMKGEGHRPADGPRAVAAGLDLIASKRRDFLSAYEGDGFAIVKGVFSLEEVLAMRKTCADVFARAGGKIGDLATYPELQNVLLDDRVLAVARAALGDSITYFGDSNFYANSRFDRHIHNDARGDVDDPSRSDYPILRMGIYLQDHAMHSNGLKVRPKSHKSVFWTVRNGLRLIGVGGNRLSVRAFRPRWFYNVPTEPGDLVFWNLRTHHAGHALRLRVFDNLALPPAVEGFLPARVTRPMPKDRYAIFMSWGRESPALDAYIKQIGYTNKVTWERSTFDSKAAREAFEKKRVNVRPDVLRLWQLGA
jgi:hypothetical protein